MSSTSARVERMSSPPCEVITSSSSRGRPRCSPSVSITLGDLPFPLLADWDKSVARRYGVLIEERGVAQRSLFLIDYRGYVRWRNPHYDWRSQEQYAAMTEAMLALPMIPRAKIKKASP
ncbi:MAG: redoxin domain-containing protein [Chloroflexi bacterium]|nr:MAG: redoxin domain-containing protein [Chloroflexota bacterium]